MRGSDRMHALSLHFTDAPLSDYARAENHSAALQITFIFYSPEICMISKSRNSSPDPPELNKGRCDTGSVPRMGAPSIFRPHLLLVVVATASSVVAVAVAAAEPNPAPVVAGCTSTLVGCFRDDCGEDCGSSPRCVRFAMRGALNSVRWFWPQPS